MEKTIAKTFDKLEHYLGYIVPDWGINGSLRFIFSKTSVLLHTVWFVYWFYAHLDITLLTNIVSLEAIYVGVLIGIQQLKHHIVLKGQVHPSGKITAVVKEVKKK